MKKQLIVVVHGVGVREAGVSTNQVTASLDGGGGRNWRPHASDDMHLRENTRYGSGNQFSTFCTHLLRFRKPSKIGGGTADERVVADFYWGDVSGTGQDLLRIISGFLRVVLGLSHAVRENARDCFPRPRGLDRALRWLSEWAALTIHGPVVAINLVILAGLVLSWGMKQLAPAAPWLGITDPEWVSAWVLGFGAVAAGYVTLRRARVYLVRHLADWTIWTGLLVLLMTMAGLATSGPVGGLLGRATYLIAFDSCRGSGIGFSLCLRDYAGIEKIGLWLVAAMMLGWAVVIFCAFAVAALSWMRGRQPGDPGAANLVLPAIALMTLLWFLTMTAVWSAVMKLPGALVTNKDHVYSALRLVVPAVAALALLALAGGLVHWRKRRELVRPQDFLATRDRLADRHRLLVARSMLWVLRLFLVLVALIPLLGVAGVLQGWLSLPNSSVSWAMAIVGLLAVVLTGLARGAFALGVGIVADVVVYLNDYSWKSREMDPTTGKERGTHTRTPMEKLLRLRLQPPTRDAPQGYWMRRRIGDRLDVLVRRLIRQEAPDSLCVLSHSQGTVIAMDVLAREGPGWKKASDKDMAITLITMGSPYTHIYNTYFPSGFPPPQNRPALRRTAAGGVLDAWVNIFRIDDFVGTHIDTDRNKGKPNTGTGWPEERPVLPGGHTGYWVDRKVIPILQKVIEF